MAGVPTVKLEQKMGATWVDLTSRLLWSESGATVTIDRGNGDDGSPQVGTLTCVLENNDGALTPRKASTYYPNVVRFRELRFSALINGTWRYRFTGFVDSEPLMWGVSADDCRVTVTAIDVIGRTAAKPLRSVAVHATLDRGPIAYWPLTDPETTTATDQSGNSKPGLTVRQWGTGGEIAWSAGAILPTDNTGGLVLTPESDAGYYLQSTSDIDLPTSWVLTVWPTPAAKDGYVAQVGTASYSLGIWYDTSTRKFSAIETRLDSSGDPIDTVLSTSTNAWTGGIEAMYVTPTTVKLLSSGTTGTRNGGGQMLNSLISVGGAIAVESGRARMYSGEIKHVALWTSAATAAAYGDELANGPASMLTLSTAVAKVLAWAGQTVTVSTSGSDLPVRLVKTEGFTAGDLIGQYARGTLARIGVMGDGSVRVVAFDYLPAPISAPSGVIESTVEWSADLSDQVGEATVTWPDGTQYVSANSGAGEAVEVPGVIDAAASVADWLVASSDAPPRFPDAPFDLLTLPTADVNALALVDFGDRLTVPGLPAQLPSSDQRGVVSRVVETIGAETWLAQFATAFDSRDRLFIVGDATQGVVGAGYLAGPLGPYAGASGAWKAGRHVSAANLNADAYTGPAMKAGIVSITPSAANTPTSLAVTFPAAFASAPDVVVSPLDGEVGSQVTGWSVSGVSTTGFTAWVTRTNTTATFLAWVATGA